METLSVSDFRSNLAESFNKVDKGENVLIRRRNEIYALIRINNDELTITPAPQAKIEKARKEYTTNNFS